MCTLHHVLFCMVICFLFLCQFFAYFSNYWLADSRIRWWNVFNHQDAARTNNAVEGWHHHFNTHMGAHPNLWTFCEKLKEEQYNRELQFNQVVHGGQAVNRRSNHSAQVQREHAHAQDQFLLRNTTLVRYLSRIAKNIHQVEELSSPASIPSGYTPIVESVGTFEEARLIIATKEEEERNNPIPSLSFQSVLISSADVAPIAVESLPSTRLDNTNGGANLLGGERGGDRVNIGLSLESGGRGGFVEEISGRGRGRGRVQRGGPPRSV